MSTSIWTEHYNYYVCFNRFQVFSTFSSTLNFKISFLNINFLTHYGCDPCRLDMSRHDPHTCNLTLMGDGVCVFVCVCTQHEKEWALIIYPGAAHTHERHCDLRVSQVCSPELYPSTYTCVARQRELMFVFLSMWEMWMRSERSGKWGGLCLERDVSAARASVAHLIWHTKEEVLWAA